MSTEIIAAFAVGLVLIVFGLVTWKKQTTVFLHSYHYRKVREEELPAYTKLMGVGQIVVGIGFCLSAPLQLLGKKTASRAVFIAGLAVGLAFILKAQTKNKTSDF